MLRTIRQIFVSKRGSTGLEETDGDALAAQAYAEIAEEQKAAKEGRAPNYESIIKKPEGDISIENAVIEDNQELEVEETDEGTVKPLEEAEEESETVETESKEIDLDAQIEEHAKKHEMTYAQAKEDIEKTEKIIEQFKNDPKEMARALRSKDREYDKLKNQIEADKKKEPEVKPLTEDQFRNASKQYIEQHPEEYFEAYKRRFPAKFEALEDAVIIEEIVDREWMGYQAKMEHQTVHNKNKAMTIRDNFIASIPEADKRFIPDVKAIIYELSDDLILQSESLNHFISLAKGQKFDAEIKAAEERGFKRAKDGATILGVKKAPNSSKPKAPSGNVTVTLNEDQKYRAEEMFPHNDGYTPEKAYEMYSSTYSNELKNNPNFVG